MKLHFTIAALLAFSVATLWIPERWPVAAVEAGAFFLTLLLAWRGTLPPAWTALPPAFFCLWAATQLAAHWTAVPAVTTDACFYWAAAACLTLLGAAISAEGQTRRFLDYLLWIGSAICIAGALQLFTSHGDVFWLFPSGFTTRVIGPFVSPNNFAAFVELLVPVALTRRGALRLPLAAALVACVAASGSRAGAALVGAEAVAVLALQRKPREILRFAGLSVVFGAILGCGLLWSRFLQSDPFAVRREFLQSTLAMFRAQPLHGFGLGTWPWTYPAFALIDPGAFANHSHNEWAQWAAEGGLPALAAATGLFVLVLRRSLECVWSIGLPFYLLHSTVDYPFLRLGMAAWFFVLAGMAMKPSYCPARRLSFSRAAVCVLLLAAIPQTARFAWADALYRRATPRSIQRAVAIQNRPEYLFALAQLDAPHASQWLQAALAANPYNAKTRIALAQEREFAGDSGAAERLLLEAARLDRQFAPAWALANFYYRRQSGDPSIPNATEFWTWARRAAQISFQDRPAVDRDPLFDLCLLVSSDPAEVFQRIGNQSLQEPFLRYLVSRNALDSAAPLALRLARQSRGLSPDPVLIDYVDASIAHGSTSSAWRIWNLMDRQAPGQIQTPGPIQAPGQIQPPGHGFDWRIPLTDGVSVTRGGAIWRIELSGREPESCELLERPLPDAPFMFRFEYRAENLAAAPSGLSWNRSPLETSADWSVAQVSGRAAWLKLLYRRPSGSVRPEGVLWLRNLQLKVEEDANEDR